MVVAIPVRANYFKTRARRLLLPFVVILVVSAADRSLQVAVSRHTAVPGPLLAVGVLPFGGPGNYFIALLLQFTLIGPALYLLYRRSPRVFVASAFAVDLAFEVASKSFAWNKITYLYDASLLRYLAAIALGFWLADGFRLPDRRNRWLLLVALGAAAYLLMYQLTRWSPAWMIPDWQPQNLFTFAYAALLVMLGLNLLGGTSLVLRLFGALGRASYHIFLVQVLYFGFTHRFQPIPVLTDLVVCSSVGYVFYLADSAFRPRCVVSPIPELNSLKEEELASQ